MNNFNIKSSFNIESRDLYIITGNFVDPQLQLTTLKYILINNKKILIDEINEVIIKNKLYFALTLKRNSLEDSTLNIIKSFKENEKLTIVE